MTHVAQDRREALQALTLDLLKDFGKALCSITAIEFSELWMRERGDADYLSSRAWPWFSDSPWSFIGSFHCGDGGRFNRKVFDLALSKMVPAPERQRAADVDRHHLHPLVAKLRFDRQDLPRLRAVAEQVDLSIERLVWGDDAERDREERLFDQLVLLGLATKTPHEDGRWGGLYSITHLGLFTIAEYELAERSGRPSADRAALIRILDYVVGDDEYQAESAARFAVEAVEHEMRAASAHASDLEAALSAATARIADLEQAGAEAVVAQATLDYHCRALAAVVGRFKLADRLRFRARAALDRLRALLPSPRGLLRPAVGVPMRRMPDGTAVFYPRNGADFIAAFGDLDGR